MDVEQRTAQIPVFRKLRALPWSAPATLILRFLKDARRDMIGFALYAETEATRTGREDASRSGGHWMAAAFLNALSCYARGVLPWLEDETSLHHEHTPGNSRLLTGSIWARRRIDVPGDLAQRRQV